jgi:hypothetical protein
MRWTGRLESNRMGGVLRTWRVQPKNTGSAKILVMQFDTIPRGRNHRRGTPVHGAATRPAHVGLLGNPAGKNLTASFCKWREILRDRAGNQHRYRPCASSADPIPEVRHLIGNQWRRRGVAKEGRRNHRSYCLGRKSDGPTWSRKRSRARVLR